MSNEIKKFSDQDDNPPKFVKKFYAVEILENSRPGSTVAQLEARDRDFKGIGAAIQFLIANGDPDENFAIDPKFGLLTVARSLRFERKSFYNLTIRVSNFFNSQLFDLATVQIEIRAANDFVPKFSTPIFHWNIFEGPLNVPAAIGRAGAIDLDSGANAILTYSILQGNTSVFGIDTTTGMISVRIPLDREQQDRYELTVTAVDSGN